MSCDCKYPETTHVHHHIKGLIDAGELTRALQKVPSYRKRRWVRWLKAFWKWVIYFRES